MVSCLQDTPRQVVQAMLAAAGITLPTAKAAQAAPV